MKKSILQQIPIIDLSFEKDKEEKRAWLLVEAQCVIVEGCKVLALDIYETDKSLLCRHFLIDQVGAYHTLFKKKTKLMFRKSYQKGAWSSMLYETILNRGDSYYGYAGDKALYSKKAEKAIRNFYKPAPYVNQTTTYAIMEVEREIAREKRMSAQERKEERIANMMKQVTPLDDQFNNWVKESALPNRYIFAETRPLKRGYRCHCTACSAIFLSKDKPKHNTTMECKKCHTMTTVKTRVVQVTEKRNILVAQPFDETTWVLRHLRVEAFHNYAFKKPTMTLKTYERVRIFLSRRTNSKVYYGIRYEVDESKQQWGTQKGGVLIDKNFMMYPERINEINDKQAKENMLHTIQYAADQTIEMDYNELIRSWDVIPYIEYLIKGRYFHLAKDLFQYGTRELVQSDADNINDLLRLDAQRAYRLREMDGGKSALKLLQEEKTTGKKVSQENLLFVNQCNINLESMELEQTKLSINQALNYFRRQVEKNKMAYNTFLNYYKDYLSMAAERRMDLTDDIVRRNPNMMEYHNRYLEEKNREADEKRKHSMRKRFPKIEQDYTINCKRFAWEDEEYIIQVPRNAGDIVEEGRLQHHCVGASDIYMDQMNKGQSYILFLRRREQPQIPYYTLEVKNNRIVQKYAAYDRQPNIKEVDKVLNKWLKEVKKREKKNKVNVLIQQPAQSIRLAVAAGQ